MELPGATPLFTADAVYAKVGRIDPATLDPLTIVFCPNCQKENKLKDSVTVDKGSEKEAPSFRCKRCHALMARCTRLAASRGLTFGFEMMSPEERKIFFNDNSQLYKEALEAKMQEVLT